MNSKERALRLLEAIKDEISRMPKVLCCDRSNSTAEEEQCLALKPWREGGESIEIEGEVDVPALLPSAKIELAVTDLFGGFLWDAVWDRIDELLAGVPVQVTIGSEDQLLFDLEKCTCAREVEEQYLLLQFKCEREVDGDGCESVCIGELFPDECLARIFGCVEWSAK